MLTADFVVGVECGCRVVIPCGRCAGDVRASGREIVAIVIERIDRGGVCRDAGRLDEVCRGCTRADCVVRKQCEVVRHAIAIDIAHVVGRTPFLGEDRLRVGLRIAGVRIVARLLIW